MTDAEKKMKKYLRSIARKLNMPRELKNRVMNDLNSSIEERREAGQTDAQIYDELGTPKNAAAELNEQMKEYTYRKSPWRWVCLIVSLLGLLSMTFQGVIGLTAALLSSQANSLGIIGGIDGPTTIFVTTSEDYISQQAVLALMLVVMGFIGFWALSRCKRK